MPVSELSVTIGGMTIDDSPMTIAKPKNKAAVALGRRGGLKKTDKPKGFAAMTLEARREVQRMGWEARRKQAREVEAEKVENNP